MERLLPQLGAQVETLLLPEKLFREVFPSETPQGVAALIKVKDFTLDGVLARAQTGPVVALAGIQDPGNLGTILRSAEAFGAAGVILGEKTVSAHNSKVIRASSGLGVSYPCPQSGPAIRGWCHAQSWSAAGGDIVP